MKSRLKSIHFSLTAAMIAVLAVLLAVMITLMIPANRNARLNGYKLGEETGTAVGKYKGSSQGMTDGLEASRKQGLSAAELADKINSIFRETESIELLSVAAAEEFSENISEAAEISKSTAVFVLDFTGASVKVTGEKTLLVTIPSPACRIYNSETQNEIAGGRDFVPESYDKTAEELAVEYTENLVNTVCGDMCSFSVSLADSKDGEADE